MTTAESNGLDGFDGFDNPSEGPAAATDDPYVSLAAAMAESRLHATRTMEMATQQRDPMDPEYLWQVLLTIMAAQWAQTAMIRTVETQVGQLVRVVERMMQNQLAMTEADTGDPDDPFGVAWLK